jgi:hypothetical protein
MPNLDLDAMTLRVLRNIGIPNDASTPVTQAKTDINQFINEAARDVWKRRAWREYIITGNYSVPADTRFIPFASITVDTGFPSSANGLASSFAEVITAREGNNILLPFDPGSGTFVDSEFWTRTTAPNQFLNRGTQGVLLGGVYSAATTLRFVGKANFQDLTSAETWIMDNENCLIAGATWKMMQAYDKDDIAAKDWQNEFEAEIAKMIDAAENQGGNSKKITPIYPFTDIQSDIDTSLTGTTWI